MNRTTLASALLALCLGAPCLAAQAPALPQTTAVFCEQPVKIDGVLDEPCWQQAQPMTDFYVLEKQGERTQNTVAKVAFDNTWLYFGIECKHPALDRVEVRHLQHDGSVHSDESIEIFIDPGSGGMPYFHFKLNLANVKAEQRATATGGREPGWDLPWLSTVKKGQKGWTAEVAIPLYELASYGNMTKARINVTRNTVIPYVDAQGVAVSWQRQLSTWSPLIRTFHEPDLFGALKGIKVAGLQTPFLATFHHEQIGSYQLIKGAYCYPVTLDVRGYNTKPGKVTVAVIDEPASGKGRTVTKQVELNGTAPKAVELLVPVAAPVQRKVSVVMADAATGVVFRRTQIPDTSSLDLITAYLDRTYYTTEQQAIAVCSLGMPEAALRNTALAVTDDAGKTLASKAKPSVNAQLPFPIANLPVGAHTIKLRWTQQNGELIFSQDLKLVKRAPKPGLEWKIDKLHRVILRDGKPFFPFGLLMAGVSSDDEADLKKVADAGFNSVAHWSLIGPNPKEMGAYLKVCKKLGLTVLGRLEACARRGVKKEILAEFFKGKQLERVFKSARSCGITHCKGLLVSRPDLRALPRAAKNKIFNGYYKSTLEPILESIRVSKDYDNLIGYNHFDEPCLSIFDQDQAGRDLYRRTNEIDGYHPIFLLYSSYISKGENAIDWCDALGTDPYWVPAMPGQRNKPNYVSKITCMTRARADSMQKMTWLVPMAEFWSGVHKRAILPQEQYCQTYLAIIHGGKAIWYFRYPILHQGTWDALAAVAKQLQVLGPIAVTRDIPQQVTYEPGKTEIEKEIFPDVQINLRHNPAGGLVLIAANSQRWPVDVTYTLSCLKPSGKVGRLFAKATHPVRGRAFADRIEPYGVRAYSIADPDKISEPVQIRVVMKADKAAAPPPESWVPPSGRPGKKNILPNPSFEEASLPGWPDYYRPWYSDPLIGNPDQGWGQDANNPYHGKYCLRITCNHRGYNGVYFYIGPVHRRPTRYVLSFYARGERDGMNVAVNGIGIKYTNFKLTAQWQRYSFPSVVPAKVARHSAIYIRFTDKGRIWLDALQFERGEEPTEFEQ